MPDLATRLEAEPPKAQVSGYGLLPELTPDPPAAARARVAPYAVRFPLKRAVDSSAETLAAATALLETSITPQRAPLAPLVDEFEKLRTALESIENDLGYHEFWQPDALAAPGHYNRNNRLAQRIAELQTLMSSPGAEARVAALGAELTDEVAPFEPQPGARVQALPDGRLVLPVTILTDIDDDDFLAGFAEAIRRHYSGSEDAIRRRFSVDLTIQRLSVESLYPEGAPAKGAVVPISEHVSRFPAGFVLTTGAVHANAHVGRSIHLPSHELKYSDLAHEFSHLLGFSDDYLRSYEGEMTDPHGVVFVEWKGISGDPWGTLTEGMIDKLVGRGEPQPVANPSHSGVGDGSPASTSAGPARFGAS